jgi:hypothetical protein
MFPLAAMCILPLIAVDAENHCVSAAVDALMVYASTRIRFPATPVITTVLAFPVVEMMAVFMVASSIFAGMAQQGSVALVGVLLFDR